MSLTHERVVIIGGSSGIGLAVAHAAVDAGAEVIIASSRKSSIDAALGQLSPTTTGYALDVLDTAAVRTFFDNIGAFDHLAYTAGESLSLMPVEGMNLDKARGFFQIRFFGALNAVSTAAKQIRPGGSITLTSGSARSRPGAGWLRVAKDCIFIQSLATSPDRCATACRGDEP